MRRGCECVISDQKRTRVESVCEGCGGDRVAMRCVGVCAHAMRVVCEDMLAREPIIARGCAHAIRYSSLGCNGGALVGSSAH